MYNQINIDVIKEYASECIGQTANELVSLLKEKKLTLSSAESCTGGLIGGSITRVSGSSEVYFGGIITYTNDVKINVLGVDKSAIEEHTEVSAPVAHKMACRVREKLGSSIGVSATGFAGPTGGNDIDPVGTVYVGISSCLGEYVYRLSFYSGATRDTVRDVTVVFAIRKLCFMLK